VSGEAFAARIGAWARRGVADGDGRRTEHANQDGAARAEAARNALRH
jgi:hypothetical protein